MLLVELGAGMDGNVSKMAKKPHPLAPTDRFLIKRGDVWRKQSRNTLRCRGVSPSLNAWGGMDRQLA
jgi:hypothetical protein